MDRNLFEQQGHFKLVLILIFIAYFILMFGNGIISLTHPDEVFYIQSAKEMVQYNKWFTPMIFDAVQFEKPFISFALFAFAIKYFGLTPFVARFWPAFFGMLGVCACYWVSWMLFGKKRQAFISAIILCSSFIYLALSRSVLTDMIFSVFVLISIGFYYLGYSREKYKSSGILLGFVFAAISVLTKGLLGFLFPWTLFIIFLLYKRDLGFLKNKIFLWGFLLFLAISLPWHIAMYNIHGNWFLTEYFGNVHVRRILESEHPKIDTWYFYLGLIFAGVLPWSLFWIPGIRTFILRIKDKTKEKDNLIFLFFWMLSIFLFVEPAHSKLASYIFPVYPAIAMFLGFYINRSLEYSEGGKVPKGLKIISYLMSVILIGIAIGANIAGKHYADFVPNMKPIYLFSIILVIVSLTMFLLNKKRHYTILVFSYLGINIALLAVLFLARPYIEPWVSCKDISVAFNKIDPLDDSTVMASKFYVRGVRFYSDRKMAVIDINGKGFWSPHPVPFLNTDQKVLDFLAKQKTTYAIVKEGNVEDLKRITKGKPYRIEEIEGLGGKYILKINHI